ncbi:MAG: leucine-rich repeat domain-containing protein [Lachnospiraceae bacterium]|nr:leucine-rich repeat domain-containing protein [Lachnospiraceae bacterium]
MHEFSSCETTSEGVGTSCEISNIDESLLEETGIPKEIADNAFKDNKKVESITVGSNITKIGDNAFSDCNNLKKVNLPPSLTKIENNAFANCKNLSSISIPENITKIGSNAFSRCKKLKKVNVGKNTTEISSGAFSNCTGLKTIIIPKNVSSKAFSGLNIYVTAKVPKSKKKKYSKLLVISGLNKGVTIK